jgi:hypothetical protein
VLLIDEVDRADEPFEAFCSNTWASTRSAFPSWAPSRGVPPVTLLTSNRTRDLNDAVKRRCLYHWLDYPERERELAIVRALVPEAGAALADQVADFVQLAAARLCQCLPARARHCRERGMGARPGGAGHAGLDPSWRPTPPASCSSSAKTWPR